MRILVAGATGALGRLLVPRLIAKGHKVVAFLRDPAKREALWDLGAIPVLGDALDGEQVGRAVAEAEPDVIVHQLTALAGRFNGRNPDVSLAPTNRLRIEATDHLLAAGRGARVKRFVAQSYTGSGMPHARTGGPVKREDDPIDPDPPRGIRAAIAALRHLEQAVIGADWTEGVVLRYGTFYGPGTSFSNDGEHFRMIRERKLPLVGRGTGVWSFVHVEDAADATVIAIERGQRGIYNIVDDEPAPVAQWLPVAADALQAPPPRHVPRWLARLLAGEAAAAMMTEARGASNEKARRELQWSPAHSSWRTGFFEVARANGR